ncbi:hypothetical protein [Haloprofundus halobius]|uniref:hypothetical protein n=1 Tax=Haloprofundus halobius TaxID=2876194 RepID=UPI001CCF9BFF|nr:hypothetical protein [Haloprofundus halobius]
MSLDCWFSGDIHPCIFAEATGLLGELTFGMFVTAIVIVPIYARTGDIILPSTVMALIAFMAFTVLPGQLVGIAWTMMFMSLALAIFMTFYKAVIS